MKKILFAALMIFVAYNIGQAQSQPPPVKQGSDAPQVKVRAELPLKGGGAQAALQSPTHGTPQGLTQQSTAQGLTQNAAQGSSQTTGLTKNSAPLKTASGAGAAKPAAQADAGGSQTAQKAPLKGGGAPSASSLTNAATSTSGAPASGKSASSADPTKLPIKTSSN